MASRGKNTGYGKSMSSQRISNPKVSWDGKKQGSGSQSKSTGKTGMGKAGGWR